jgi:hypothetical protein
MCQQSRVSSRRIHFYFFGLSATITNRVEEDMSELTFEEWTPVVDTSRSPVTMLINSNELRSADFKRKEVLPATLEVGGRITW